jgi:sulfite reductase alpha subunit-like flavoprotein
LAWATVHTQSMSSAGSRVGLTVIDSIGHIERCTTALFSWPPRQYVIEASPTSSTPKGMPSDCATKLLTLHRIDGTFVPWLTALRTTALQLFPLPAGESVIPDEIPLQPKWKLDFLDGQTAMPQDVAALPGPPLSVPNGMLATVHANSRLTPSSHFQDTRHLILSVEGHYDYLPGSTVTIYPQNAAQNVDAFVELMSWTNIVDRPIRFVSLDPLASESPPVPNLPSDHSLTLRILLIHHLDIMAIPRRSFFKHLLYHATEETQMERLQEFVSPELIDELYDYTTRPRRSILEVMADFTSVKLPWQYICDIIPLIRGRKFSIASGGALKSSEDLSLSSGEHTRIDLLIAIVKYQTVIRRIRHGLATRYIATLQPGQTLQITLQPASALGVVPGDASKPVVMVAPGTGLAPMRALSWDRKEWRRGQIAKDSDKDMLFFGCRKKDVDDYFSGEWQGLDVDAITAYSRDQVFNLCKLAWLTLSESKSVCSRHTQAKRPQGIHSTG